MLIAKRYQIQTELKNLGESAYHHALDLQTNQPVNLRSINLAQMGAVGDGLEHLAAEKLQRKMENEKRIMDKLKNEHPNLLTILDSGYDAPIYYQIFAPFDYESLKMRIGQAGKLSLQDSLAYMLELAEVCAYLHDIGIVHCDINPENIIFVDGRLKLVEFTIANHESMDGAITGTLPYLSPEALQNAPLAPSRDIWGLGTCLYECLTGELPFGDVRQGIPMLFKSILQENPKYSALSEPMAAFLGSLLAKVPEQRPRDMRAVQNTLKTLQLAL